MPLTENGGADLERLSGDGPGGTLTAVRQNLETAAAEALEARGRTVNVAWRENKTYDIHNESRAPSARSEGDSQ